MPHSQTLRRQNFYQSGALNLIVFLYPAREVVRVCCEYNLLSAYVICFLYNKLNEPVVSGIIKDEDMQFGLQVCLKFTFGLLIKINNTEYRKYYKFIFFQPFYRIFLSSTLKLIKSRSLAFLLCAASCSLRLQKGLWLAFTLDKVVLKFCIRRSPGEYGGTSISASGVKITIDLQFEYIIESAVGMAAGRELWVWGE